MKTRENIILLDEVDSTNSYLKERAGQFPDGTVVIARRQTCGRGRTGKTFVSADGGLYLSYLLNTGNLTVKDTISVTSKAAVAVSDAIFKATGIRTQIKWVNDIILNSRKICGILVDPGKFENGIIPYVIIGIGININQNNFPAEIGNIASSFRLEVGREYDVGTIAEAIIKELDNLSCNIHNDQDYIKRYRDNCCTIGREILFEREGEKISAVAIGITDDYGLIVKYDDEIIDVLKAGEVSVRGIAGYV